MFAFVRRRAFVVLVGLLLIAAFIWFIGPYFAFANYRPLETEFAREVAIALVVVLWAVSALLKWFRASRANDQLVGAVLSQSQPEKDRPSAEAAKLRQRFEEAVATLKQRSGHSLYSLPWYVFIGAPGSGKTTALLNSGLKFPLEQRVGKAAVRGVGGTRNCDWWFTDEAVFLDTAGRYTTQDSDAASDSEGWKEFLALLGRYRKRRPVNGIVLTISAQDLMVQGDAEREAHVEAARHRLTELTRELRVEPPVYLMVTKCDMVAGFTDYFDDLTQEGRAQVWGVTFPFEQTASGAGPDAFPAEFDELMARLNGRVFTRLGEERGTRRRASIFAFPQQMAALRDPLTQFVSDVFSATHFDRRILLRGIYFTSGTQDGTQIDRLLGAVGRRLGVAPEAVAPAAGRGKSYFVEQLLKDVVIPESGLAGVNRRLELKKAAWQLGTYAGIVLAVAIGIFALSVSYVSNSGYLDQVAADVTALRRMPPAAASASLEAWLPHLNAVRAVSDSANRYRGAIPFRMRWGLYQGESVGNSARDAYLRELDRVVLPRFANRIRQRLIENLANPDTLVDYLKAYLMFGEPRRLDKKHLQYLADREWKAPEAAAGAAPSLATHVRSLLESADALRPIALDQVLIAKARSAIGQASIPKILYGRLQRSYTAENDAGLRLDIKAGVGIEQVLKRKSGRSFSEPIPSLYTQEVFKEVTGLGMAPLVKQFAENSWVWGGTTASPADWAKLTGQVTDLYETDYISRWDALLNDLEIVPLPSAQKYADALGILGGQTSPLSGLLRIVVANTSMIAPPAEAAAPSITTRIAEAAKGLANAAQEKITGVATVPAGTAITEHFKPIHQLMSGAPSPLDGILDQIRKIRDQLLKLGPQAGGASPLTAITDPTFRDLRSTLQTSAENLPSPVNALVVQIAQRVGETVGSDATKELVSRYAEEVVAKCRVRVEGRYPFGGPIDMPLSDFSDVFGYGGLYDKFFMEKLDTLVDRLPPQWVWRPGSVTPPKGMLEQFQRADRIRQMFFSTGSKAPKLQFNVRLANLDSTAMRFYLDLDGQKFEVKPGAQSDGTITWPGSEKGGTAIAIFVDSVGGSDQADGIEGPWALFRLVDERKGRSGPALPDADLRSFLTIHTTYHQATVTIEATNGTNNPFAARDWRQFTCGP